MTVGAGGGLNVLLKSLLDPEDEVVVLAPFFVEYEHYVESHAGRTVIVQTNDRFRPDPEALARSITPRTRAVFVNSPNNPTGVVYDAGDLEAVGAVLRAASAQHGRAIYLVSDEPYRAIVYDGVEVPWPIHHYPDTVHVTSFSKDLSLPGERIGYVAVAPRSAAAADLVRAMVFSMRALGFVNAPALQQRLVESLLEVTVDLRAYTHLRQKLLAALAAGGFDVVRPDGAFYVFPRTPGGMDDVRFAEACMAERLLVVPGRGFGRAGYFRISYAVEERTLDLAIEALARVCRRLA
jgi:aspartate aminotransferase